MATRRRRKARKTASVRGYSYKRGGKTIRVKGHRRKN